MPELAGKGATRIAQKPKHFFAFAIAAGIACHWLWSYVATVAPANIFFWEARDANAAHALFYPISLITLIATIAIGALAPVRKTNADAREERKPQHFQRLAIIGSSITCISTLLLIWAQSETSAGTVLLIFAGLGTGIGSGIMLPLCWSEVIQFLNAKYMLASFAASTVASFSALLAVKLAPREAVAAMTCLLPLAEMMCFLLACALKDARNKPKTLTYRDIRIPQVLFRIGTPSAIFGMILGLLQELSVTKIISSGDGASQAVLVIGSLFAASLVLCSFVLFGRGERRALAQVLFLVTIISLSLVFAYRVSDQFTLMTVITASVSLHLMAWVFALEIVRQGGMPAPLSFATLYGSMCIGTALSVLPIKLMPSINELLGSSAVWPVAIVASFAIAYSFWPSKKDVESHMVASHGNQDGNKYDSFQAACRNIAEQYALSPRETEVLELIAQGRSVSYIGEALYISPNTAKSHRRRLYEKLGMHKNQEVISLVQTVANNEAADKED